VEEITVLTSKIVQIRSSRTVRASVQPKFKISNIALAPRLARYL